MRRPLGWVGLAVLLVAAGALLMWIADDERAPPARAIAFPRGPRPEEVQRTQARRTLPAAGGTVATAPPSEPSAGPPAALSAPPPRRRDPFLVSLPTDPGSPLLVLEANALRHSRVGELFIRCVLEKEEQRPLQDLRDAGIEPLKDVDRVAFTSGGVVVSGFFEGAHLDVLTGAAEVTPYGEGGRLHVRRAPGGDFGRVIGTWRDQLILVGVDGFAEAAIDRLEGRAPVEGPVLTEDLTYGEAYGVLPGAALQRMLAGTRDGLGERLAALAPRVELHADAMHDVAVVARVTGPDAAGLEDLAKAFGAALSVGRLDARVRGDRELADLLEHARVAHAGTGFQLELALPIEVVERWSERCGAREGGTTASR